MVDWYILSRLSLRCSPFSLYHFLPYSRARTRPWRGFPKLTLSVKTGNFRYKTCSFYVHLTQQSFCIPSQFAHRNHCGMHYQSLWLNCCKTSSFKDTYWGNNLRQCMPRDLWDCASPRSMHKPSIHRGYPSVMSWSPAARAPAIGSNRVWCLCDVGLLQRIWAGITGLSCGPAWRIWLIEVRTFGSITTN